MPTLAERLRQPLHAPPARIATIGIPAYNEETSLPRLLRTVFAQDVPVDWDFEVHVVPNGCADATEDVARAVGHEHVGSDCPRFVVRSLERANKADAMNAVHDHAPGEVVVFLDADIELGGGVLASLCEALAEPGGPQVAAPAVRGVIADRDDAKGRLWEGTRIGISRAINAFDDHLVRLDGRAFGYRRDLIDHFPNVIAIDYWVEGVAWSRGRGCRYLRDVRISYQLPVCYTELVKQYTRYDRTIADFTEQYPEEMRGVERGRAISHPSTPPLWARAAGFVFLGWVRHRASSTVFHQEEPWEPIASTKR